MVTFAPFVVFVSMKESMFRTHDLYQCHHQIMNQDESNRIMVLRAK